MKICFRKQYDNLCALLSGNSQESLVPGNRRWEVKPGGNKLPGEEQKCVANANGNPSKCFSADDEKVPLGAFSAPFYVDGALFHWDMLT